MIALESFYSSTPLLVVLAGVLVPVACLTSGQRREPLPNHAIRAASIGEHTIRKRYQNSLFTYYEVGQNACGSSNDNLDYTVALSPAEFKGGAHCHQPITMEYGGKQVSAIVTDQCLSCSSGDLDLTLAVFVYLAGALDPGELRGGSWDFDNGALASTTPKESSTVSPSAAEAQTASNATHIALTSVSTGLPPPVTNGSGSLSTEPDGKITTVFTGPSPGAGSVTTLVDGRLSTISTTSSSATASRPDVDPSHSGGPSSVASPTASGPPRRTILAVSITLGTVLLAALAIFGVSKRRRRRQAVQPHLLLWEGNQEGAEKALSGSETPERDHGPSSDQIGILELDDVLHITHENIPPPSTPSQENPSTLAEDGSNAPASISDAPALLPKRAAQRPHSQRQTTARSLNALRRRSVTHIQRTPGGEAAAAHSPSRDAETQVFAPEPMVVMPLALAQRVLGDIEGAHYRRSGGWSEGGESLPAYEPWSSPQ
ncbi:hypothetical protein BV20DRAFT_1056812 [Pilatotrama ljubarskyi]|nr:hypothetical protein BV20DRAFT_1056812 [Pilatotrama ljubarskyi]